MNRSKRKVYLNIVYTAVMVLCLMVIMIYMYHDINEIAVEDCFATLHNQAQSLLDELTYHIDADERLLQHMSEMLAELSDVDRIEAEKILSLSHASTMLEEVELVLPDGRVMTDEGMMEAQEITWDYEETVAKGIHLTHKIQYSEEPDIKVIYFVVPVERESETIGLLCGRINLADLQEEYLAKLEQNGSRFHIVEGVSREALVDTTHQELGVMADLRTRKVKKGFDAEQSMEDLTVGRTGEIAFYSNTLQEYMYSVYAPVGREDWVAMLSLPESVAFQNVRTIRMIFFGCVLLEGAVLLVYFALLLKRTRRDAIDLEEQYVRSKDLLKIEEQVFHSVINPESMNEALRNAAELVKAERVYLMANMHQGGMQVYCSDPTWPERAALFDKDDYATLWRILHKEGKVSFYDLSEVTLSEKELKQLQKMDIHNGMGIVLLNSENQYRGILFAVNMSRRWQGSTLPLEWMHFGFAMALDNLDAFRRIKEIGSKDQLTGLLNRNSYQKAMEFYEKMGEESLNCIYIDVDGLHELNNRLGHSAGDQMLTTISKLLQEIFGEDTVYRIGGDEFLIFCTKVDEQEMEERRKKLLNSVMDAGYHISLGVSTRKEAPLVYEMVRLAESRMYEAKRQYYREQKNGQKVREMNRQLEATLLEKRDLDVFCSVLAYKYVGVYIVNLSLDSMRAINMPSYFVKRLQAAGGKFSATIQAYVTDLTEPAYHEAFWKLLDYEELYRMLVNGQTPELEYTRNDGVRILLKIYQTPDFDEFQKECIWTFEVVENDTEDFKQ